MREAILRSITAARSRGRQAISVDTVMLPLPNGGSDVPLPFGVLQGWRGDVQFGFGQLIWDGGRPCATLPARLSVADGAVRLDNFTAKLGSGTMNGDLAVDATADPPAFAVETKVSNAIIAGPLDDAPIDLLSGRADATARLRASGYSPSAIFATLGGRGTLTVNDGARRRFRHVPLETVGRAPGSEVGGSSGERCVALGGDRLRSTWSLAQASRMAMWC